MDVGTDADARVHAHDHAADPPGVSGCWSGARRWSGEPGHEQGRSDARKPDRGAASRTAGASTSGAARRRHVPRDACARRCDRRRGRHRAEPGDCQRAARRVESGRGGRQPRCVTSRPEPWRCSWCISSERSTSRCCWRARRSSCSAICGFAASWMRRHPLLPDLVFFALTVIGLLAVLRLPQPGIGSALALMVGLITWIVTLRVLTAPLLGETPAAGAHRRPPPRLPDPFRLGGRRCRRADHRRPGGRQRSVDTWSRPAACCACRFEHGEVPAGASVGVAGIEPWRTPNKDFYIIHTALAPPAITPEDWQLRIHGMVENELTFSYQDLVDRKLTEAWVTLCCVSNEVGGDLIGNAWWSGVLVREILAEAGVQARCRRRAADLAGRLDLRYAARGPHRRPQRDARRRDERPAAAARSTASRCGWWCPGSTGSCRRPSGWSTSR